MVRLSDVVPAYSAQLAAVTGWIAELSPAAWDSPSRLDGWTVRDLALHAVTTTAPVAAAIVDGAVSDAPLTLARYTAAFRAASTEIADRSRRAAQDLDPSAVLDRAASAHADLLTALSPLNGADPVVMGTRGPLRLSDLLVTRVNEIVVHGLDLSASVPEASPIALDRSALGICCRMLTGILAEQAPGRTVEVRVPPYAAVQCIEGPRHTRGTPPNVIEMEPVTWVELATGRAAWAVMLGTGRIRASGERADLSGHLPVLA